MPAEVSAPCDCIMAAHCPRPGICRLKAGGTVNAGGGVCTPKHLQVPAPVPGDGQHARDWRTKITISVCKVCDKSRDPLDVDEEPCGHDPETHRRAIAVDVVPASERDAALSYASAVEGKCLHHEDRANEAERLLGSGEREIDRLTGEVERLRAALTRAHEQISKADDKGPKQIGRALMTIEGVMPHLSPASDETGVTGA
jgi:hypothetical protein